MSTLVEPPATASTHLHSTTSNYDTKHKRKQTLLDLLDALQELRRDVDNDVPVETTSECGYLSQGLCGILTCKI